MVQARHERGRDLGPETEEPTSTGSRGTTYGMLADRRRRCTIQYLEGKEDGVVSSLEFPWSQYHVGLSVIAVALMTAVWTGARPLVPRPDLAWGSFVAISAAVSALMHAVVTREMKLGTASEPPEIRGDERP